MNNQWFCTPLKFGEEEALGLREAKVKPWDCGKLNSAAVKVRGFTFSSPAFTFVQYC